MGRKKNISATLLACFAILVRGLIRLRYRIEIEGADQLPKQSQKSGILFLPNHPAEMDPVILLSLLFPRFHLRPFVVEHFYYSKEIHFFMRWVNALPLPSIEGGANQWKLNKVSKLFHYVAEELKQGENFLIYPAGKLKRSALEEVGGASGIHSLLQVCPDAEIVLVRTTGLWGSSFSRAQSGASPNFGKTLLHGLKTLLKNGIFFAPRRKVKVEFLAAPADFPRRGTRLEINSYLEDWYNRYPEKGPEPLNLVSYSFWKEELPKIYVPEKRNQTDINKLIVPAEIEKEVKEQLAKLSGIPSDKISREQHLSRDLGLDSLDIAQVYLFLDEKYEVGELPQASLQNVIDVLAAAVGEKKKKKVEEVKAPPSFWPEEPARLAPQLPVGDTLIEAFLHTCDQRKNEIACADELSGLVTYQKLKRIICVLALRIEEMPGEKIGILLPSSVGTYAIILATLLAGKIPVMLNWTAGVRSLNHAREVTSLRTVLSSRRFLDRLQNGDLGEVEDILLLLEDVRHSLSLGKKLLGLFLSCMSSQRLLSFFPQALCKSDDTAVVLFTSGTETLPKAVPLTHAQLLANQRAALSCAGIRADDLLYGVLPPFHSFGFSVTGLLPLLAGWKVFYSPDPTDSHGMERDIFSYRPTVLCCAPSFILSIFRIGNPEKLQSVRLFVAGAEKTPEELFTSVAALGAGHQLIEGYGITECGPIVTLNRPDAPRKGVGPPLPGVELCVIDAHSLEILPSEKEGEICIRTPSLFNGYLGDRPSPFITLEGKNWYRSGDRGHLAEGALILSGRLKRFVKMGGEMVSLGGIEEEILRLAKEKNWNLSKTPSLAVSVREVEGEKPLIILFTTFDVSKDEINRALKESGMGKLVKIADVKKIEEIPLTGTGKTHYRLLDQMN